MTRQQALEHSAEIRRRPKVAAFMQRLRFQPGQSASTRPPRTAPPASIATVAVP